VGAELDLAALPRPRGFETACRRLSARPGPLLLAGGEDYELLFTLRPRARAGAELERRLGVAVREIGRITAARGVRLRAGGRRLRGLGGFRHF
jgi:thiamine-monophosphate kinase